MKKIIVKTLVKLFARWAVSREYSAKANDYISYFYYRKRIGKPWVLMVKAYGEEREKEFIQDNKIRLLKFRGK